MFGLAALLATLIATVSPAHAVCIPDRGGKCVMPPLRDPAPDLPRKSVEDIAGDCGAYGLLDPNAPIYTSDELAAATVSIWREITSIRTKEQPTSAAYPSAEAEIAQLMAISNELQRCIYNNNAIDRMTRALDSCEALMDAVAETDRAAASLYRRQGISRGDWIKQLQLFLPAAQMCRNKLGRCYNPDNRSQAKAALVLMHYALTLKYTSQNKTELKLNLPACNKTQLRLGLDKPKGPPVELDYLNAMIDSEFIQFPVAQ